MAQLAANKYATALYELAQDGGMDALNDEAKAILNALTNEPNFLETLLHPRVTAEEKIGIINGVFSNYSKTMLGFLNIVIKKNRENELVKMLHIFLEKVEEYKGIINAEVITASPLKPDQIEKIKRQLTVRTNKTVNLAVKEDPSLIGGLCIKAGGLIFDNSVKKQLDDMRMSLIN